MAYRWSLEGPGFEFPTPYTTENRFLRLRAYALVVMALAVLVTAFLAGATPSDTLLIAVEDQPQPGSAWPHVLVAALIAGLGVLDFLQLARQRSLLLVPGQPGGLIAQVRREGSGISGGTPWLLKVLGQGQVGSAQTEAAPGGWWPQLSGDWALAPTSVQAYRQTRLSHLVLGSGLLLFLVAAMVALNLITPARTAGLGLVALLLVMVGVAAAARQVLDASKPALSPLAVGAILVLTLLACGPIAWWADSLPRAGGVRQLGLPWAAGLVLVLGLLTEALGWRAAAASPDLPEARQRMAVDELRLPTRMSPAQLMRDVDLELHRRWQDGVPNRRYAWKPTAIDGTQASGPYSASVLEESQPQPRPPGGAGAARAEAGAQQRRGRLLALGTLALVASVGGAGLWLWTTWVHMGDGKADWITGALGLSGLLAGAHALRVAHLLWSRVETDSTITWLEFSGTHVRQEGGPEAAGRQRGDASVRLDSIGLKACVAQARSVFYAAGGDEIGSRRLLGVIPDAAGAAAWTQLLDDLVRKSDDALGLSVSPARAAAVAPAAAARPRSADLSPRPDVRGPLAPQRPASFCTYCGSPALPQARFCPQCGTVLASPGT